MAKKVLFTMLVISFFICSAVSPVSAQTGPIEPLTEPPSAENGEMTDETPKLYFVELAGAPTIMGRTKAALKTERAAFRTNAKKVGMVYEERRTFETLWNGFTISAKPSEVNKLNLISGVIGIFPVQVIPMPKTTVANPELWTALEMTGASAAQSELGFTGKRVKVAVMDTGIDVNHPAFGGNGVAELNSSFFYSSPRVKYGYDLVGDAYDADDSSPTYNPVPSPDPIPDDCGGHGTHVAGIIGANDATNDLKGVAPDVTFGAYRVFGCNGSTTDEIMLMAMERAYRDRMQVLNMSIGSPFAWPQSPTAKAASRLVDKGMVVVASIGNSGDYGLYAAGAPGLGEKVIGVASYDNTNVFLPYFTVNEAHIGYVPMTYSPDPPVTGDAEIVYIGRGCVDSDTATDGLQTDPYLADPAGKTALIIRGACSFAEKASRAIDAGANAVVVMNNTYGVLNGTLGAPLGSDVPVVGISGEDGMFIRAQTVPIMMIWTDQQDSFPSPTGGLISTFSSYGLSPDLALKPDIGAPGGNIYSSYPLELGGYATLSGTSMSSPHVAGAAALFLQAHPKTKAADVRSYLQNNAVPQLWSLAPSYGLLDMVHRQGAGMLQIDKAILAKTTVEPSKLALGESQAGAVTKTLTLRNSGNIPVTYTLSYENAITSQGVLEVEDYWGSDAEVVFSSGTVVVTPRKPVTIKLTITPASGPDQGQYGGYIIFTGDDGSVLRVPYAGFVGDYQSITALTPTDYGFPWLAILYGGSFYGPVTGPGDWVYTMEGEDIPYFLVHFEHQVRTIQFLVYNAETGKPVVGRPVTKPGDRTKPVNPAFNTAVYEEFVPRNSTTTGFYAFGWDGTLIHKNGYHGQTADLFRPVPDGNYFIVIKALKALGDPKNPVDYETWTSPVIAIDRP